MAIIEGTGIVAAGKEARAKALAKSKQVTSDKKIAAEYKVDPIDRMIRDIESNFQRLREEGSTGAEKNTGRGMGDTFDPSKDFRVERPTFFSMTKDTKVASTDLSGLVGDDKTSSTFGTSFTDQASANLADASIYQKKEDGIYRPSDNIYDDLKEIKRPKIEEKKPYLDSTGDYFDKKPFTETDGGSFYGSTDAKIIQRKGDDMRFSQSYSRDDKGKLTGNYQKEYSSYLQSGEGRTGVPFSKVQADQIATGKTPRTTGEKLGAFFLNRDKYMSKDMERTMRRLTKPEFEQYRRDLVKTAAEKSIYGADVEVGKKRFVEGTGFDETVRNPDFTYTKTGEKINQLQDTNIPKGEGYFFKDFYKPGEFKTKEDLNRYLTDRGAYMTGMPSNFEGGVSGRGEKTDDLTSMYRSTAGDFKKENEKKEPSTLQKVGNFLGDVTNKALGIQTAEASQIGGPLPSRAQTPTSTPKQTVASLPSNYKQTESEAFRKAAAFKEAQGIAKRNPNVSVGVDNKGQPKATATNDSGVAKAQAAAVNRKLQGKTISQVKAENKKSMQDAARKRNEAFQKSKSRKKGSGGFGKSTSTNKKSAPKKAAPKKAAPKKKATPSTNKRAQAAAKRRASQAKAKAAKKKATKKKAAPKKKKAAPKKKKSISRPRRRTRRGGRR